MDDLEYHPNSETQTVASITPSQRLLLKQVVSLEAKQRVQAVDPNKGRCLIEHCDGDRAVEYAHCFPRYLTNDEQQVTSLEYWWNMKFQTLNLDTRYNIFPVNASLHHMFDKPDRSPSWTLLPEDNVITTFWNTLTRGQDEFVPYRATRAAFPTFPGNQLFVYRLLVLPNSKLRRSVLTHQHTIPNDPEASPSLHHYRVYSFPFNDYPTVQSHIRPHFVILEAGRKLSLMPGAIPLFTSQHPILTKVLELYGAWTAVPPRNFLNDPEFNPSIQEEDSDDEDDKKTARGRYGSRKRHNNSNSPLNRVQKRSRRGEGQGSRRGRGGKQDPDVLADDVESRSNYGGASSLSGETLRNHDEQVGKVVMAKRIIEWVQACAALAF